MRMLACVIPTNFYTYTEGEGVKTKFSIQAPNCLGARQKGNRPPLQVGWRPHHWKICDLAAVFNPFVQPLNQPMP